MASGNEVTTTVRDRNKMIANMSPALDGETYVYCAVDPVVVSPEVVGASIAVFREREGLSVILPLERALELGLPYMQPPLARITLEVYSSHDGVGLTAAVAGALADQGIPCNMVAALHHDHAFVPIDDAQQAVGFLLELQKSFMEPRG